MLDGQTFPAVRFDETPTVDEAGIRISILFSIPRSSVPQMQRSLSASSPMEETGH